MAPVTPPIEHAAQLLELLPRLARWARDLAIQVSADLSLSLRQYAALREIREGARTASDLARQWQVTPAVITGVIDRLERRGLARREADPRDRRRLRLALTPKGLELSRAVEHELTGALAAHLAAAEPSDLLALGRALAVLNRAFSPMEQDGARERPAPEADKPRRRRPARHGEPGARSRKTSRRATR